jgi:hypothetical protein
MNKIKLDSEAGRLAMNEAVGLMVGLVEKLHR